VGILPAISGAYKGRQRACAEGSPANAACDLLNCVTCSLVSRPAEVRLYRCDALLPIVGPFWPRVFGLARVRWAGVTG